ncbi:hypothetical protein HYT56_01200 [Candidatus Woesearchaeota archaeon]|nr:hypothetical protein [Candidatus Woesearchaeota archaeon]
MQFAGKLETLNMHDRQAMKGWVERFLEKQGKFVDNGLLKLRLEQRREKFREVPLFFCRANFFTDRGKFIATGEEYGIQQCVNIALNKVKKQLLRQKSKI